MNPEPFDPTQVERAGKTGRSVVLGQCLADVVIGGVAIVEGVTHGASWLIGLCALSLIGDVVLYRYTRQKSKHLTPDSAAAFSSWVRTKGIRYGALTSVPIFVAIGIGAHLLSRH